MDLLREFTDQMHLRSVANRMNGIEAKTINAIILHPVNCILDKKTPYGPGAGTIEIKALPPRCGMTRMKKILAEGSEVISIRPQVIVNHIQDNLQAVTVGGVDQTFEIIWGPV